MQKQTVRFLYKREFLYVHVNIGFKLGIEMGVGDFRTRPDTHATPYVLTSQDDVAYHEHTGCISIG